MPRESSSSCDDHALIETHASPPPPIKMVLGQIWPGERLDKSLHWPNRNLNVCQNTIIEREWKSSVKTRGTNHQIYQDYTFHLFLPYIDNTPTLPIQQYHDLHHWRLNQWPQIAEPKVYNRATNPYRLQVTPN